MKAVLQVLGVGVWAPGVESFDALAAAAPSDAVRSRPDAQLLPVRMRGRASVLTALFASVVEQAARAAAQELRALPMIFGSAYGEMDTLLSLLAQLSAPGAQLSPAKFQASVHNTAAGQLSIALGNPSFSTSIAAGRDTVTLGLFEASAWLARHPGCLVLAFADEGAHPVLQPSGAYPPLGAAFVLASRELMGAWQLSLGEPRPRVAVPCELSANPCAPAWRIAQALRAGREAELELPLGPQRCCPVVVHSRV